MSLRRASRIIDALPGLAAIEGWYMRRIRCQPILSFGYEDHSAPIANVIYTYHGANKGVLQDAGHLPGRARRATPGAIA